MKYYILKENLDQNGILVEDYKSNLNDVLNSFAEGESLNGKVDFIQSVTNLSDGKINDLIDSTLFTVSGKLKDILFSFEKNLEAFPLSLVDSKSKKEVVGYFAINILNTIESIDRQKSTYDYDEELEYIERIHKLILDENKVKDRHIFREFWIDSKIIVSERVKDALVEVSGLSFIPVEEFKSRF